MGNQVRADVTEPTEKEQTVGFIAGSLWAVTTLAGGASLAWLNDPGRTIAGVVIGVPWLLFGVWWLMLFLRRTGRSYRAGSSGSE